VWNHRSYRAMLHSALINVMVKAARRAGRSLKRDLGEIEHLQVSLKGPANFVSLADKRAEEMLYDDLAKARPGLCFHRRGRGRARGADKSHTWIVDPWTGTTNFLHGIPAVARISAAARDHADREGVIYNPPMTSLTSPSAARVRSSTTSGFASPDRRNLDECVNPPCGLPHIGRGDHQLAKPRDGRDPEQGRGPARFGAAPRSTSPSSPPAGSTAMGAQACSNGNIAAGQIICVRPAASSTGIDGHDNALTTGHVLCGQ